MAGHLLIEELIRRQIKSGKNNTKFAEHLGIPRPSWVLARRGLQRLSPSVLRDITKVYKDLAPVAGDYLLEGAPANALAEDAKALAETVGATK